jgi:hypothetical protein
MNEPGASLLPAADPGPWGACVRATPDPPAPAPLVLPSAAWRPEALLALLPTLSEAIAARAEEVAGTDASWMVGGWDRESDSPEICRDDDSTYV